MNVFEYLFQEATSFRDRMGDTNHILWLHIIGGFLIALTFSFIGMMCLVPRYRDPSYSERRLMLTRMFGLFLLSCGLSRLMDTIAIWHNYIVITGIIKLFTGLLALRTIFFIPVVLREVAKKDEIDQLGEKLSEVSGKMDQVQQISDNLESNKK